MSVKKKKIKKKSKLKYVNPSEVEVLPPKYMAVFHNYIQNYSIKKTSESMKVSYNTIKHIVNSPKFKKYLKDYLKEQTKHFRRMNVENAWLAIEAMNKTLQGKSLEKTYKVIHKKKKRQILLDEIKLKPPTVALASLALRTSGFYTPKFIQRAETKKSTDENDKALSEQIDRDLEEIENEE